MLFFKIILHFIAFFLKTLSQPVSTFKNINPTLPDLPKKKKVSTQSDQTSKKRNRAKEIDSTQGSSLKQ